MKTILEMHAAMRSELDSLVAKWRRRKVRLHVIAQRLAEASVELESLERQEAKASAEQRRRDSEEKR